MNINVSLLGDVVRDCGRLAVALSGGLDSSVLLAFAVDVLGADRCLALTAKTPYMMSSEQKDAGVLCGKLGVRHLVVDMPVPVSIAGNPPMRCYECKKAVFNELIGVAGREGFVFVADGTNSDDDPTDRPGMRALKELGIISPFADAGLGKDGIRELGKALGLGADIVNKPAYACLLTRLQHGVMFTPDDLRVVDEAENYLRGLGFPSVRVRVHGKLARIELPEEAMPLFFEGGGRDKAVVFLRGLGFEYVSLDLQGYRQGSMNKI